MSPRKRDPKATLEKAIRLGAPLKVRLSEQAMAMTGMMLARADPTMPMKKKPVFAEEIGPELADAMRRLDPTLPLKKSMPSCILEDTFCFAMPPLRLAQFAAR